MKAWRIESSKAFVVPNQKMKTLETLIKGVGGKVVIDEPRWDGTYVVHTEGYMETDSLHVARRILKLVHSFGGRVRLHAVSDRLAWNRRKENGYRRSVAIR